MEAGGKGGFRCGTATLLDLNALPQDCIAAVLSFTSPRDACRLSLVSTTFKSAAQSDIVWERFLPSDYHPFFPSSHSFSSMKELYFSLCQNPVLIDGGRKVISPSPLLSSYFIFIFNKKIMKNNNLISIWTLDLEFK